MTSSKKNPLGSLVDLFSGNGPTLQTILVVGIFTPILTALVALAISESVLRGEARITATVSNLLVSSFFTITVIVILRNKRLFSWIRYLICIPFLLGIFLNLTAIFLTLNGDRLQDIVAEWKAENLPSSNHRSGNLETEIDNYTPGDNVAEKTSYQRPHDPFTSDSPTRSGEKIPYLASDSTTISETEQREENLTEPTLKAENFIRSKLQSGTTLHGTAWDQSETWPFVLTIDSIDNEGFWNGRIQWPTLNSINRIQGLISGSKITFVETEKILPGKAAIGVNYILNLSENNESADGVWIYKGSGNAKLKF